MRITLLLFQMIEFTDQLKVTKKIPVSLRSGSISFKYEVNGDDITLDLLSGDPSNLFLADLYREYILLRLSIAFMIILR